MKFVDQLLHMLEKLQRKRSREYYDCEDEVIVSLLCPHHIPIRDLVTQVPPLFLWVHITCL